MTEINKNLLEDLILLDFAKAVKACASESKMFSIIVDGVQCSFGNKRLWKTAGAAKSALTIAVTNCLWHSEYWNECITKKSTGPLASFDWKQIVDLKKKHKYTSDYDDDSDYAKIISKHLIDSKKVEIVQVN